MILWKLIATEIWIRTRFFRYWSENRGIRFVMGGTERRCNITWKYPRRNLQKGWTFLYGASTLSKGTWWASFKNRRYTTGHRTTFCYWTTKDHAYGTSSFFFFFLQHLEYCGELRCVCRLKVQLSSFVYFFSSPVFAPLFWVVNVIRDKTLQRISC